MNSLEWNPVFGPVALGMIVLGCGAYFYLLLNRAIERHGRNKTWLLLLPKMLVVGLLVLALLDPELKLSDGNSSPAKVLILQDISTSMDLKDDGSSSRNDRAKRLIEAVKADAPATVTFETVPFDTVLHEPTYQPMDNHVRGTDLAAIFLALGHQPKLADADGILLLTDGGDETVELAQLPSLPLAIIGVGASPEKWNDIGIGNLTAPASVEENSQFDLVADLYARAGTHEGLGAVKVILEQQHDQAWTEIQNQTVDLSALHAAVTFHVQVSTTGALRYRIRLPELPGELTYANNTRIANVQVQQRALHVLYFTEELGIDYKYLRNELGSDPGVLFTAMYRVLEDQFTVQGDRTGYQDLAQGFPVSDDILKRYDCIILGSFPASEFTDAQAAALVHYVETGGALVLLGGESSFGRGGYADSKMAKLIPWAISSQEPDLVTGNFPVSVSPSGGAVELTSGLREDLATSGGASLESLNQPGALRPGAIGLLDASTGNRTAPVVVWQRYGQGQVLGIASNTLWKWAAQGHERRELFGRFWRQSVRGLTRKLEGGSLLGIHWNQEHYRPGEVAIVEVQLHAGASAGALRFTSTLTTPSGDKEISLASVPGQAGLYSAKIPFEQRGDYTFRLSAYNGSALAESYERALPVQPLVEEGANPELKEDYLRRIATRTKGVYTDEAHLQPVTEFLHQQIVSRQASVSVPLVNFWNIFVVLAIMILLGEWILRRRYNLI